jgi:hypothetical protein
LTLHTSLRWEYATPFIEEASVFDQFNGMPMHVLLVHAAVVFVPLLALTAIVYAVLPRLRSRVGWAAALLAVGAPAAAFVAKLSGQAFKQRLLDGGMKGQSLANVTTHQGYGDLTFWFSLALGVATLVMVYLTSRGERGSLPRVADLGLAVVVVGLAAVSGYYVFRTGDTGAVSVWGGQG